MDNTTFDLTYVAFNIIEGFFWIGLGLLFVYAAKVPTSHKKVFSLVTILTFTLFGISDFVESQVGSFFESGTSWLFIWKVLCVVGLLAITVWYVQMKSRKNHT